MAGKVEIPKVKLGSQGLEVSKIGYGCLGLTGFYNDSVPDEDGISIIKEAFNRGITFFDTSDSYGVDRANENLVAKALKQLPREKIQLATKFGVVGMEGDKTVVCGTPEFVRSSCEASLKRLGVDHIDLYYAHRIDQSTPIEHTIRELKKLVEEGKVKYIGLSEASADTIKRAHAVHPLTAIQMNYSIWTREMEDEIIPLLKELGIGIVAYSPLGHGFFAGKGVVETLPESSFLQTHPRFTGENLEKNKILYTRTEALAKKHDVTIPQLALAWLLNQGVVPIPGTRCVKHLEENLKALNIKLTKEDLKEISDAVPMSEVKGETIQDMLYYVCWKFANTPPL